MQTAVACAIATVTVMRIADWIAVSAARMNAVVNLPGIETQAKFAHVRDIDVTQ